MEKDYMSLVGCSIDFRLTNIISERLKLAQNWEKWWQRSCKTILLRLGK